MAPRVLLLGGHGKVSLLMTPQLLARSWNVTSVIRDPSQTEEIVGRGKGQPGKVDVLVRSLDDVKSDQDAQKVLDEVKPDFVVWSAGAGGKGGAQRTWAVDRDAAKHFISTSIATPTVKKFLLVSHLGSRRSRAPWWTEENWQKVSKTNKEVLPTYYAAKVEADEYLTALAKKRRDQGDKDFQSIILRPGLLTEDPPTGKISLGKIRPEGQVTRADVAAVAVSLLERDDTRGWYDLLNGETGVKEAIDNVVKDKVDCVEGEEIPKL